MMTARNVEIKANKLSEEEEGILKDISIFYRKKLIKINEDTMDTVSRTNLDGGEGVAIIVRNLICCAAMVCGKNGASKQEFMKISGELFDLMMKGYNGQKSSSEMG